MSKFLDLEVKYQSYENAAQSNDPADTDKVKSRVQESSVSQVHRLKSSIADATVDQVIALPANPSDYLLIFSDQNISVKLNGISTAIALKAKTPGTKCPVLVLRASISALSISNSSGNAANVDIILSKI